jgi:hypothetical protein
MDDMFALLGILWLLAMSMAAEILIKYDRFKHDPKTTNKPADPNLPATSEKIGYQWVRLGFRVLFVVVFIIICIISFRGR